MNNMKYWWLNKYKNFKIIEIINLNRDINYFLTMPKNYGKKYEKLKNENIDDLDEEDLVILLKKIVESKNIKDNTIVKIIEKLLLVPDNSFPASDYSLEEMINEVKSLRSNLASYEKLSCSNVAVCYSCLNVFYVDKIKRINKNNLCLCPFCSSSKMYFDCDYIPMNYLFIKLAYLYYNTSRMGCTFKEIKRILKKEVKISNNLYASYSSDLTELLSNSKLKGRDEKVISKEIYDILIEKENNFEYEIVLDIGHIRNDIENKLLLVLLVILSTLSNTIYLKKILINVSDKKTYNCLKYMINTFLEV